jgi:phosphotransferase system  glucose/maltose/N-acetylglucosamine-specific IIC component
MWAYFEVFYVCKVYVAGRHPKNIRTVFSSSETLIVVPVVFAFILAVSLFVIIPSSQFDLMRSIVRMMSLESTSLRDCKSCSRLVN